MNDEDSDVITISVGVEVDGERRGTTLQISRAQVGEIAVELGQLVQNTLTSIAGYSTVLPKAEVE